MTSRRSSCILVSIDVCLPTQLYGNNLNVETGMTHRMYLFIVFVFTVFLRERFCSLRGSFNYYVLAVLFYFARGLNF